MILVVFALSVGAILCDWFGRGRFRPQVAVGCGIIAAAISVILVAGGHSPEAHHTKFYSVLLLGMFAMCAVGSLVIDNANISDRENGCMSKFGSFWDGFEDNYFSNIIDKWETYAILAVLLFCMGSIILKPEKVSAESQSTEVAKPAPASHHTPGKKVSTKPSHARQHKTAKHASPAHR